MAKHICVLNGHPDPSEDRFVHALSRSYAKGAELAGFSVETIDIGGIALEPLGSAADFETPPDSRIQEEREKIARADHIMFAFPLWLGSMPAKTRAFIEQTARGGFYLDTSDKEKSWPKKMMAGKSARVIVTMGMPAIAYKLLFDSGALKAVERGLLGISGFKPVRHTVYGGVDAVSADKRATWLDDVRRLGAAAQ